MTTHLTRAYRATLTDPPAEPDPDTLITSATAAALAGGVSLMTIWRWTRDDRTTEGSDTASRPGRG